MLKKATSLIAIGIFFMIVSGGCIDISFETTSTYRPTDNSASATATQPVALGDTPLAIEIIQRGSEMALVPSGDFSMGSADGEKDERPAHTVYLDAFYIDKYEVTNELYGACVYSGVCPPPTKTKSWTRANYFDDGLFGNYPVIYVDWTMADSYCKWRGASLPTEAEWEKAARGTDGRSYPMGETINCNMANYSDCQSDTTAVDMFEKGKSAYGVYGMAGNVYEWVADWYDSAYYESSPRINPLGPAIGRYRVMRGGSWSNPIDILRSTNRSWSLPLVSSSTAGFRCVLRDFEEVP